MSTCIGHDQLVFTLKLLASGMDPVIVAPGAAVEQEQRRTSTAELEGSKYREMPFVANAASRILSDMSGVILV